jgi:hypothetical protein
LSNLPSVRANDGKGIGGDNSTRLRDREVKIFPRVLHDGRAIDCARSAIPRLYLKGMG